jgi:hypothetical protein
LSPGYIPSGINNLVRHNQSCFTSFQIIAVLTFQTIAVLMLNHAERECSVITAICREKLALLAF